MDRDYGEILETLWDEIGSEAAVNYSLVRKQYQGPIQLEQLSRNSYFCSDTQLEKKEER